MLKTALVSIFLLLLNGCYYFQPTTVPISHKIIEAPQSGKRVMILLPGIGDRATAFEKHNTVGFLQEKYPDFDVVAVDAHFRYYNEKTVVERLKQDIVQPYLDKGYEVYMGGISLGGLGTLLYLKYYPEDLEKILLLAPYLGETAEYQYLIDGSERNEEEIDIDLWPWITSLEKEQRDKIYLAYGLQDKFAIPNGLLAKYLPKQNTITINGEHRWTTWKQLWPELIERAFFKKGSNYDISSKQ